MQNVYTVGQVNAYIKNMFTQDFLLKRIDVKGEVSNCKYHGSGHIYFSLKDSTGTIACVMFAGSRKGLAFRLADGQQVVVRGAVSVYERDGRYQLYASEIRQEGAGELYERFLALKQELQEMGMFAQEYKQPVPAYVKKLGIVTAPAGAAVRDIMNISRRRNPFIQLVLYPALVQGEKAADSIARGIQVLDDYGVDAIIVGRGGGSIEDLWAFNEEKVARAIFSCKTPVISAVGHETDFTIADFVADLRAPTPSAAAELAVADVRVLLERLRGTAQSLDRLLENAVVRNRERCQRYRAQLEKHSPENQIREKRQFLLNAEERMERSLDEKLQRDRELAKETRRRMEQAASQCLIRNRHRMMMLAERMKGVSPLEKLSQGYAWLSDEKGRRIASVEDVKPGMRFTAAISDGRIFAVAEGIEKQTR